MEFNDCVVVGFVLDLDVDGCDFVVDIDLLVIGVGYVFGVVIFVVGGVVVVWIIVMWLRIWL